MDTFAALALSTDPASPVLLDRKSDKLTAPLFTVNMHKQILLQSAYQIAITLVFHFCGLQILGLEDTSTNNTIMQTVVFNIFVFAQIFSPLNSRRLDRKLNIFEGVLRNRYFIMVTLIGNSLSRVFVISAFNNCFSCRDRRLNSRGVRWQLRLPGHTHWGSRVGYFACPRCCVNSVGCSHSPFTQ